MAGIGFDDIITIIKRIFTTPKTVNTVRKLADDLPDFTVLGGKPIIFGPQWLTRRPPWETTADRLRPGWTPDSWKKVLSEEELHLQWERARGTY